MYTLDHDSLSLALDLLRVNKVMLEQIASQLLNIDGFAHHEVIIICGSYSDFWKEFIDGVNPEAEAQAAWLNDFGQNAVSLSAGTKTDIAEYLLDTGSDIRLPNEALGSGKIWHLVLHERGHNWLQA